MRLHSQNLTCYGNNVFYYFFFCIDSNLICCSKLLHVPQVVNVYGISLDCGSYFMEYCPTTLAAVLCGVTYPPPFLPPLGSYTRELLEGMVAMHACHIYHRDIKPGNILVRVYLVLIFSLLFIDIFVDH